jgi:hypothetical protein
MSTRRLSTAVARRTRVRSSEIPLKSPQTDLAFYVALVVYLAQSLSRAPRAPAVHSADVTTAGDEGCGTSSRKDGAGIRRWGRRKRAE